MMAQERFYNSSEDSLIMVKDEIDSDPTEDDLRRPKLANRSSLYPEISFIPVKKMLNYKPDTFKSDNYKPDQYKLDGYKPDNYKSNIYKPDHYKSDTYKSDIYRSDNYKSDKYKSDNYNSDNYKPDNYKLDSYKLDNYKSDNYNPDNYTQDHYNVHNYKQNLFRPQHFMPALDIKSDPDYVPPSGFHLPTDYHPILPPPDDTLDSSNPHCKRKPLPLEKCPICKKFFRRMSTHLQKHTELHAYPMEQSLNCRYCAKAFNNLGNLTIHMRTHTGLKPYICDVCHKGFTQSCNLTNHRRIHTGERPFKCPYCDRAFTQSGNLSNHIRLHLDQKPFKCHFCERAFTQSGNLNSHIRNNHRGEAMFL